MPILLDYKWGISDFQKIKKASNCLSILFSEMWHHKATSKLTFLRNQLPLSSGHRKYHLITTKLHGITFQMWKPQISFWLHLQSQLHTPPHFQSQWHMYDSIRQIDTVILNVLKHKSMFLTIQTFCKQDSSKYCKIYHCKNTTFFDVILDNIT
jgi:hypothetical protein